MNAPLRVPTNTRIPLIGYICIRGFARCTRIYSAAFGSTDILKSQLFDGAYFSNFGGFGSM